MNDTNAVPPVVPTPRTDSVILDECLDSGEIRGRVDPLIEVSRQLERDLARVTADLHRTNEIVLEVMRERDELKAKIVAMVEWLDKNQGDVWYRGIWDVIDRAKKLTEGK